MGDLSKNIYHEHHDFHEVYTSMTKNIVASMIEFLGDSKDDIQISLHNADSPSADIKGLATRR